MYVLLIIIKRANSTAPFFVDTEIGQQHNVNFEEFKAANSDKFLDHIVFRTPDTYVSRWEFVDEAQALAMRELLATDVKMKAMTDFRDSYTAANGQEYWARKIKEDGTEQLIRFIPPVNYASV